MDSFEGAMSPQANPRKSKMLYFKFHAPWTGALVVGVSICAISLLGIYTRLAPISREAELKWLCKKWEGANPEPGTKWEKAKAYKRLKHFTGAYEAYRFCSR